MVEESNRDAFDALVARFKSENQAPDMKTEAAPSAKPELPDSDVDAGAFLESWQGLRDVHQFHGMLATHKVQRHQAMRLALGKFTDRVPLRSLSDALTRAAAREVPIMVFVGNRGCIQIHTGPVSKIQRLGPWLNVLDPDFNLHVREDQISDAFVVRKPTEDGVITALEIYGADNQIILSMFGARKPGIPELDTWRNLAEELCLPVAAE